MKDIEEEYYCQVKEESSLQQEKTEEIRKLSMWVF